MATTNENVGTNDDLLENDDLIAATQAEQIRKAIKDATNMIEGAMISADENDVNVEDLLAECSALLLNGPQSP